MTMDKEPKTQPTLPSLDMIYDLSKSHDDFISNWANSIDNKAIAIFSIAGTLIAILSSLKGIHAGFYWDFIFFCIAIIAFISTTYFCWSTFRTRQFIVGNNPKKLLEQYAILKPDDAKRYLIKHWGQNYAKNLEVVKEKGHTLRYAIISAAAEVFSILIWLILSSIKF